jgi:putative phosphoribosyl transferase
VPLSRTRRAYRDRNDAGTVLARELRQLADRLPIVVLALPRGGVPVAAPVANSLSAQLGLVMVRKLGLPGRPELAMGALAYLDDRIEIVRNESVIAAARVSQSAFDLVCVRESTELERLASGYPPNRAAIAGATVIVVDDGLATGSTMLAAVAAIRRQQPTEIVVGVPVGARQAVVLLREVAEAVICPSIPEPFTAVGEAYQDFTQVDTADVIRWLSPGS